MHRITPPDLSLYKQRPALITGGCGFIGSHLVDVLVAGGMECAVVDNLFQQSFHNLRHLEGRIRFYRQDIRDQAGLDRIFAEERPGLVFHLAAHHYIPYCNQHPVEAFENNVIGTQRVAEACRAHGAARLFFASTAAVYGASDTPHRECDLPNPLDIYGVTKYAGEKIVTFLAESSEVPVTIGRYFNAAGPRETNPHILPELCRQVSRSLAAPRVCVGNTTPQRDYIDARDLAEATAVVTSAARNSRLDIVNIGSGVERSVTDLVAMFEAALGTGITIEQDPARMRASDRPHLCADVSRLRETYGWTARMDLLDSVRDILAEAGVEPVRAALACR